MDRRQFIFSAACATAGVVSGATDEKKAVAGGGVAYSRALPVECSVDVFIAGGGPGGIAAAIAAARGGANVFLAESTGAFGGAATAAYVPAFACFSDGKRIVVGGIGGEIRRRVSRSVSLDVAWTPLDLEELKRVYDAMVAEAGVRYSFFTTVVDVGVRDGHVEHVVLSSKRGLFAVKAKVFIDATGDGDLCAFAGGAFEKGDATGAVMPPTLCTQWADIDFGNAAPAQSRLPKAIEDGVFSVPDLHLSGIFRNPNGSSVGGGNVGHVYNVDPTDERSLTKAMVEARRQMVEYVRFYREYVKGHEKAVLVSTAPCLGVRESRRIVCDYRMTVDDFLKRAQFEDQIGRYCYAVDIHRPTPDKAALEAFSREHHKTHRYHPGESYGIPYRSLVAKDFSNVLVAGRCIGSDRQMNSSIRVMPACFITGQAAGTAATMALAKGDTRAIDIAQLRDRLKKAGAIL